MKHPNIVFVGHVCIDNNKTEHATYTSWGSPAIYMANYLRLHNISSTTLTSYGADLLSFLPDIHLLPAAPDQPQTLVYENDTRQQPRIWRAHHTEHAVPPELSQEMISLLRQADILVVAPLLPNYAPDYVRRLLEHLKPATLKLLCPQGYLRHVSPDGTVVPRDFAEAAEVVPLFDLTVISEDDHPDAIKLGQSWVHDKTDCRVIVTQGEHGASIVSHGVVRVPTIPIEADRIVDSVGCGDVFAIATARAFYESHNIEQAVQQGHQAARHKLLSSAESAAHTQSVAD